MDQDQMQCNNDVLCLLRKKKNAKANSQCMI